MKKILWMAALLTALAVFFTGCPEGDKGTPGSTTYTGKSVDGKSYELIVTGDDYEIKIDGASISTGKVSKSNDTLILTPNGGGDDFTVTVDGNSITKIEGKITDDNGNEVPPVEILPPFTPTVGAWTWATSDDSKTNEWKLEDNNANTKQTVFEPGGASRITNAVEADEEGNYKPYEYPTGSVKDNDGNTITVPVYNFTGNTKVLKDNRTATEGAGWPMVGWEAVPDEDTLEKLKTAYGYSFWVKLNSATGSSWAFLTAVVTDFVKEEGHEFKHWFGNQPGGSGGKSSINNYTKNLEPGKWHQITVIMDQTAGSGFNMYQDKWIWQYDSGVWARGDFHQDKASKIQWQIPLQHQKIGTGEAERSGEPYDVIKGSYDFNLDFYGLELLMK